MTDRYWEEGASAKNSNTKAVLVNRTPHKVKAVIGCESLIKV